MGTRADGQLRLSRLRPPGCAWAGWGCAIRIRSVIWKPSRLARQALPRSAAPLGYRTELTALIRHWGKESVFTDASLQQAHPSKQGRESVIRAQPLESRIHPEPHQRSRVLI